MEKRNGKMFVLEHALREKISEKLRESLIYSADTNIFT